MKFQIVKRRIERVGIDENGRMYCFLFLQGDGMRRVDVVDGLD
jgi:hypothetical protein